MLIFNESIIQTRQQFPLHVHYRFLVKVKLQSASISILILFVMCLLVDFKITVLKCFVQVANQPIPLTIINSMQTNPNSPLCIALFTFKMYLWSWYMWLCKSFILDSCVLGIIIHLPLQIHLKLTSFNKLCFGNYHSQGEIMTKVINILQNCRANFSEHLYEAYLLRFSK